MAGEPSTPACWLDILFKNHDLENVKFLKDERGVCEWTNAKR
jgi:hypothetical protein